MPWIIGLTLSACALPDSKLVRSTTFDAGSAQQLANDSGIDAAPKPTSTTVVSVDSGTAASDADGGPTSADRMNQPQVDAGAMPTSTQGGSGGAPASMAKSNGELCRGNEDCANGNCKTGENGERRCYGALKVDQTCIEPYDCNGYSCVPLTLKSKTSVCVDKTACPMQGTCFEDYGIAICQLDQQCSAQPGSFNQCYQHACTLAGTSNAQCLAVLPSGQSLNESGCCPTGGALNSSCNTARQCGCGDGMKCDIDSVTAKPACEAVGSLSPGGSCMTSTECPKSFGCTGNVCKQYCDGPNDTTCAGDGECNSVLDNKAMPTAAYYCTRTCDPLSPTSTTPPFLGCSPGTRCNPTPDGHTDCSTSGSIPAGSSCDDGTGHAIFNGCAPGSICLNPPKLVCAPFCRVGQNDCKAGTCRSFGMPPYYVLQTEVGFCDPP